MVKHTMTIKEFKIKNDTSFNKWQVNDESVMNKVFKVKFDNRFYNIMCISLLINRKLIYFGIIDSRKYTYACTGISFLKNKQRICPENH